MFLYIGSCVIKTWTRKSPDGEDPVEVRDHSCSRQREPDKCETQVLNEGKEDELLYSRCICNEDYCLEPAKEKVTFSPHVGSKAGLITLMTILRYGFQDDFCNRIRLKRIQ